MIAKICETGGMKTLFIIASLAAALASPSWARAQQANEKETQLLGVIARCLIEGLPSDWQRAQMILELDAPGAPGGAVSYLFSRTLSRDQFEPFTPCDERQPAAAMADIRALQPPGRSGWKTARFVLNRDGKFDLTYDYPK
jgi:type II secretory pathway pseudopilin PulG